MSQGPYQNQMPPAGPPPKSGGGMKTVLIVLLTLGVLSLVCCGGCVAFFYVGGQSLMGAGFTEIAMQRIRGNQEVIDKFGEPLTQGLPTSSSVNLQEGGASTVEFELSGPKGKGKVHAELTNTKNGPEPTVIRVTAPDGSTINVPTGDDPTNLNFDAGLDEGIQMEEEAAPATPPATEGEDATE